MGTIFVFFAKNALRWAIFANFFRRVSRTFVAKQKISFPISGAEIDWKDVQWYAEFSKYAYKRDDNVIRKRYDIYKDIYIHQINSVKYVVITDHQTKHHYISIRGTDNSHNALQDINFIKDKSFRLGIYLHTGFHRTSEKIADDLLNRLDRTYDIYITGHSLGGADAVIVAWYLDYSNFNVVECITFGQPKVTDTIGVRKMRGKIKITRVVNETDIITLVPPAGTHRNRYAHIGNMLYLMKDGKYCYLTEPMSLSHEVNSFWLLLLENGLSFYRVGKELPDHYMTSYLADIKQILDFPEEVAWESRNRKI